jgi:hypothetical protein
VRVDVENVSKRSALEALWALGALEPKKRLKRPDARVGLWWKGVSKTALQGRHFLPPFHRYRDLCGKLFISSVSKAKASAEFQANPSEAIEAGCGYTSHPSHTFSTNRRTLSYLFALEIFLTFAQRGS